MDTYIKVSSGHILLPTGMHFKPTSKHDEFDTLCSEAFIERNAHVLVRPPCPVNTLLLYTINPTDKHINQKIYKEYSIMAVIRRSFTTLNHA